MTTGELTRPVTPAFAQITRSLPPPDVAVGPGGSFLYGQSGGVTASNINVGVQTRNLDSAWGNPLKAQMLRDLPRDKEIVVATILGDEESKDLAIQIYDFLKSNGYKLRDNEVGVGVYVPTPHGLSFDPIKNLFLVGAK